MKTIIVIIVFTTIAFFANIAFQSPQCRFFSSRTSEEIIGNGVCAKEVRPLAKYLEISIHGSSQVHIQQCDESSVEIQCDENILPIIKSEIKDNKLRLGPQKYFCIISTPITYIIKSPYIQEIKVSGSSNLLIDKDLKVKELSIHGSGASHLVLRGVEANKITIQGSGCSTFEIQGKAYSQFLKLSGGCKFHGLQLKSEEAIIHVSGTALCEIDTKKLEVKASGSSTIVHTTAIENVTSKISGSAKIYPTASQ